MPRGIKRGDKRKSRKEVRNASNAYCRSWRREQRLKYREFMSDKECSVCGYANPFALCWHHVDGTKDFNVSSMVGKKTLDGLLAEVEKCVCLCMNCHTIIHREVQ